MFVCLLVCLARERSRAFAGPALSECQFLVEFVFITNLILSNRHDFSIALILKKIAYETDD